jgi:tetratricopeptide (TPR) repeat protein
MKFLSAFRSLPRFAVLAIVLIPFIPVSAAPLLVENGEARAEIVIAETPKRSARLAAADLQLYLKKISGARLPIVFHPSPEVPVRIFVGESSHAAELGVTPEGLAAGAYRMISGEKWLALIGDDTDFVPVEPWARNNSDRVSGKLQAEWEKLAGYPWGVPNGGMYKHRQRLAPDLGLPDGVEPAGDEVFEIWNFDERGSYNAVCGFLRELGVRWYLPGEIGEVVPAMKSIPLPKVDKIVEPDFPVRQFNVRWSTANDETMFWMMRLGIRQPYGLMIAHGMDNMTHTDTILTRHPDWFALYGGKRDNTTGERLNHLCYSNRELFDHTVRWARAQFDIYDYTSVSIMPPDAYIAICQCDLCEGKDVPEMGSRGKLSNHVWDFVNRVAVEVGKTHPDKKILCCAYGANTNPPTNITKLEPNVQVMIVGGRRPRNTLPEQREEIQKLRAGWLTKTDNPLMVFENYPFTDRGWYLPAFTAKAIGDSINATKEISSGEDIWLSMSHDFDTEGIGFNHFQVYFTARMYWGGKEQDPVAMLDEYCRLFYGPASSEMKAFFEYCEPNWQSMETEVEPVTRALELFSAAKSKVSEDSVYGKRMALIDDFLEDLRSKSELLSQKRGPVSKLRTVWEPKEPIVIDGKLDESYWREVPASSTGRLRELETGRIPTFGTQIMAAWDRSGSNLYLAIRCEENPGEELNIATTEKEDPSIWYGDAIEIHLDTDAHRYYQIAVNPAGALVDLDRGADRNSWFRWESQAEVATQVADDHWTVEIRIPVTEDENDPLNQVVGRKPSQSLPWHFNICRQRIRENGSEHSAFSPTGTAGFHEPMKFAQFYDGRSHAFDVDPTVSDYLIERSKADALQRGRNTREALEAWVALSRTEGLTDLQRSDALSQAVLCARQVKDEAQANELAGQIPVESIRKTAQMENLFASRKWEELLEQFGAEDIASWPFPQIAAGAYARGRAAYAAKKGEQAEADFLLALPYVADPRVRLGLLRSIAHNREMVLGDDPGALEFYRRITEGNQGGGADYYYGLEGAARILTRQQDYDGALAVFDRVDFGKTQGSWRSSLRLSRADVLAAAGKAVEARKDLEAILADNQAQPSVKARASTALEELGGQ